jgi:5-methylcytosine-specific restriction protein A
MPHKASTLGSLAPGTIKPRLSANARGYGRAHQKLRQFILARDPICKICHKARSTDADHIVTIRERPDLRFDPNNLRGTCKSCHSRKTAQTDHGFGNNAR